jgi:hypothetical protein
MTSSVFIKTQLEDLGFLEWVFKFITKNWKTPSQFVVCAPHECTSRLMEMSDILDGLGDFTLAPMDQWPDRGYTHQQYMKMHADNYCDGDLITFLDSDAMLVLPTDVETDLCVDGKPIIWYTEYARLNAPWQFIVSQIMAINPKHEFMRCFPFTYHRSTLKECRERLTQLHGCPLEDVMHRAITWSEFNVMGLHAFVFQKEAYTWKHTDLMFTPDGLKRHWHDRVRHFHRTNDWNDTTRELMETLLNGHRESSGTDGPGLVGEEGRRIEQPDQKRKAPRRRLRVPEPDLPTHPTGITSD